MFKIVIIRNTIRLRAAKFLEYFPFLYVSLNGYAEVIISDFTE